MPEYEHMLVDGRNALYRAIYAGLHDKRFQESGADYFTILTRFLHHYYASFKPNNIHVFWDDKSSNLWRTKIYPEYKETSDNSEIREDLHRQYKLALDLFRFMGFRQYYRAEQEADDLIYAFCRSFREPTVIVSSDSDLKQIPCYMPHVSVYNPTAKAGRASRNDVILEDVPTTDIVMAKAMIGDKADNIHGYVGVGPVKGGQYATNLQDRIEFLNKYGDEILRRNRQLIDLSLCPHLLDNLMYVEKHRLAPVKYDYKIIVTKMREYGVSGGIAEADRYIAPFSRLI